MRAWKPCAQLLQLESLRTQPGARLSRLRIVGISALAGLIARPGLEQNDRVQTEPMRGAETPPPRCRGRGEKET